MAHRQSKTIAVSAFYWPRGQNTYKSTHSAQPRGRLKAYPTAPHCPMLTGDLRNKVDQVWNAFWSGGIANPIEVIEQITYLLFLRALDSDQTREDNKALRLKTAPCASSPGSGPQRQAPGRHALVALQNMAPAEMFDVLSNQVFPSCAACRCPAACCRNRVCAPMRDARFTIPRPACWPRWSICSTPSPGRPRHQGRPVRIHARQNRLCRAKRPVPHPRHIIDLMVALTGSPHRKTPSATRHQAPADFLVAAGEYLPHLPDMLRVPAQNAHFHNGMFHGYDFDNTMLRIGSMNMVLHGVSTPPSNTATHSRKAPRATPMPTASSWPTRPLPAASTTSTAKDLQNIVKTKRPSCSFWPCSCACSNRRACRRHRARRRAVWQQRPTKNCAASWWKSKSSTPSSACRRRVRPTRASAPPSCSSPKP